MDEEKPMRLYKQFMIEAFIAVALIGALSFLQTLEQYMHLLHCYH